jgi:small subunit ribosomal protein S31
VEKHVQFLNSLSVKQSENDVKLSTWNVLQNRELKLLVIDTPQNIFQEIIEWTEKGMIWKFPINNEQGTRVVIIDDLYCFIITLYMIGMEEEEKVHFSEHIFLERHLKDWCPSKGPLRHFMELVCVGLSKNSYMTVNEKIEHITWYRNYFEDKKEMLKNFELLDTKINSSEFKNEIIIKA